MNTIHQFALLLVYLQAIGVGIISVVWLYSKAFGMMLDTLKVHAIFREFLVDRVWKFGDGFRRKARKERG